MTEMHIFSPVMAKAHLALMDTTVGDSRDHVREKALTVSQGDLFPTDLLPKVNWILPKVALLLSEAKFGKSAHTIFNLVPDGSSELIRSWIE